MDSIANWLPMTVLIIIWAVMLVVVVQMLRRKF